LSYRSLLSGVAAIALSVFANSAVAQTPWRIKSEYGGCTGKSNSCSASAFAYNTQTGDIYFCEAQLVKIPNWSVSCRNLGTPISGDIEIDPDHLYVTKPGETFYFPNGNPNTYLSVLYYWIIGDKINSVNFCWINPGTPSTCIQATIN
jgi:hypothetical protein